MGRVTRAYEEDKSHLPHTTLIVRLSVSINVSGQNFNLYKFYQKRKFITQNLSYTNNLFVNPTSNSVLL